MYVVPATIDGEPDMQYAMKISAAMEVSKESTIFLTQDAGTTWYTDN